MVGCIDNPISVEWMIFLLIIVNLVFGTTDPVKCAQDVLPAVANIQTKRPAILFENDEMRSDLIMSHLEHIGVKHQRVGEKKEIYKYLDTNNEENPVLFFTLGSFLVVRANKLGPADIPSGHSFSHLRSRYQYTENYDPQEELEFVKDLTTRYPKLKIVLLSNRADWTADFQRSRDYKNLPAGRVQVYSDPHILPDGAKLRELLH